MAESTRLIRSDSYRRMVWKNGGGITTEGLIERCWQALKPGGRLVANVVTLEGESVLVQARQAHGGDLARFAVQRAEPVGRFHGWHAMMPVTQWSVTKE